MEYPYFGLLHFLKAKLEQEEESLFSASVYAANRSLLKDYMEGNVFFTFKDTDMPDVSLLPSPEEQRTVHETFSVLSLDAIQPKVEGSGLFTLATDSRGTDVHEFLNTEIQLRVEKYMGLYPVVREQIQAMTAELPPVTPHQPEQPAPSLISTAAEVIQFSPSQEEIPSEGNEPTTWSSSDEPAIDQKENWDPRQLTYNAGGKTIKIQVSPEAYAAYFNPQSPIQELNPWQQQDRELIDNFLEHPPSFKREEESKPTQFEEPAEEAFTSVEEDEDLVSETLAKLALRQGRPDEAIRIYRKLSLLFPEKSTYFEAQIEKI
ncbi:MAG: hypothetical protein AAGI38_23235 [Bacteroidota bacterium]